MAEWLPQYNLNQRILQVVGLELGMVALCTLGKHAWLLFPHSIQVLNQLPAIGSE